MPEPESFDDPSDDQPTDQGTPKPRHARVRLAHLPAHRRADLDAELAPGVPGSGADGPSWDAWARCYRYPASGTCFSMCAATAAACGSATTKTGARWSCRCGRVRPVGARSGWTRAT